MSFQLMEHQAKAVKQLGTGKVLVGGVGSGKSITALAYCAEKAPEKPIIVITTAKKRNSGEWYTDAMKMSLRADLKVDSWNKIADYEDVEDHFVIFDEQKLVGKGAWTKSFQKIAKHNDWLVLTATPADTYVDMAQIWIANGFFKNITEFNNYHVRFSRYAKYPKIEGYYDTHLLDQMGRAVLVDMPFERHTIREQHHVDVEFDRDLELQLYRDRWYEAENRPVGDVGELMRLMRTAVNTHESRYNAIRSICEDNPRVIIFYNHNPELDILRELGEDLGIPIAEWNGHKHEPIPDTDRWIYLVQYQAAGEGWNCISTDTMVFFSLPYSYRMLEQAMGRIDRMNTPYTNLHYYILRSRAIIDQAIWKALSRKKNFQAAKFAKRTWPEMTTNR